MTIHAFLSHSLFFFFDFQKPTKTAVTSTRFKHKKFLVWKTLLVWTPAWSHMSTVSLSLRLCLCGLWVYLHAVKIVCMCCTRILVFMLHLCKKKKKKKAHRSVWVLWVSRVGQRTLMWLPLCYFNTWWWGHEAPRITKNVWERSVCVFVRRVCMCMCVCVIFDGPMWPYWSLCICVSWRRPGNICSRD